MNFEEFSERFKALPESEQVVIYNNHKYDHNPDEVIYNFDEDTLNEIFSNPYDAMRAAHFGKIESWNDDYFRFDGYANIVSMSTWDAEQWVQDSLSELFEDKSCWKDYIDDDDDDDWDDDDE